MQYRIQGAMPPTALQQCRRAGAELGTCRSARAFAMELVPRKAMTIVSSFQDTSSFVSCSSPKHTSVFWIHPRTMLTM